MSGFPFFDVVFLFEKLKIPVLVSVKNRSTVSNTVSRNYSRKWIALVVWTKVVRKKVGWKLKIATEKPQGNIKLLLRLLNKPWMCCRFCHSCWCLRTRLSTHPPRPPGWRPYWLWIRSVYKPFPKLFLKLWGRGRWSCIQVFRSRSPWQAILLTKKLPCQIAIIISSKISSTLKLKRVFDHPSNLTEQTAARKYEF